MKVGDLIVANDECLRVTKKRESSWRASTIRDLYRSLVMRNNQEQNATVAGDKELVHAMSSFSRSLRTRKSQRGCSLRSKDKIHTGTANQMWRIYT